ncbi:hypothetical protein BD414DRAFT_539178 [Trametes punicea]|nr:hypothetical protein BD414DRAFT_539178 [Trametes punicea]
MGIAWSKLMRLFRTDDNLAPVKDPGRGSEPQQDAQRSKEAEPPSGPGKMELRLMVETDMPSSSGSVFIDGKHWTLSEPVDINSESLIPYVCVSYVWGQGRAPNPIHPSITMSDRTLATLTAAVRHQTGRPIWIDAFCVPLERMKKRATLESLGFLFSRAEAVVAVLAPESIAAVEEMEAFLAVQPQPGMMPDAPIVTLETDEWIRSVWTYQEIVNAKALWFVGRDDSSARKSFSGRDLLKIVGGYLDRWGRTDGRALYGTRLRFPHADNFQNLLADWEMAAYAQRSALQIMHGLDHRASVAPANHFYSMIGALTDRPSSRATNPSIEQLAERFMELCEEKGDYSFIFCAAPRDERPGLRWRPVPCIFPSLLEWYSYGEGQEGMRVADGVLLKNVLVLSIILPTPNPKGMSTKVQSFMLEWLGIFRLDPQLGPEDEADALMKQVYKGLTMLRWEGPEGEWYPSEFGVFYPLHQLSRQETFTVIVALGVPWTFGAPAMASLTVEGVTRYEPGVFVGSNLELTQRNEYLLC